MDLFHRHHGGRPSYHSDPGRLVYAGNMTSIVEILAAVPLFSSLSKKDLNKLSQDVHERTFAAGETMTDQDELGWIFTIVAKGRATVSVNGQSVRSLGPGEFFGEMALIDRTNRRAATVTADTDLDALMLTQPAFRTFAMRHPEVIWALLEHMVARVREADSRER
jgi:CRP/FNR family transcriptional regulator, cyclic AMP receptor protein